MEDVVDGGENALRSTDLLLAPRKRVLLTFGACRPPLARRSPFPTSGRVPLRRQCVSVRHWPMAAIELLTQPKQ